MREITFKKADYIKLIAELASYIDSLDDGKEYILTVKEKKKKKSLNANSYFWVLCDKLAEKTNIEKTAIYRSYIKEIGGNSELICIQDFAVEGMKEIWEGFGIGWQVDILPSKLEGYTDMLLYKGSSKYDTEQMSRLINLVVQDCKENDIETLTPQELERLCEKWGD